MHRRVAVFGLCALALVLACAVSVNGAESGSTSHVVEDVVASFLAEDPKKYRQGRNYEDSPMMATDTRDEPQPLDDDDEDIFSRIKNPDALEKKRYHFDYYGDGSEYVDNTNDDEDDDPIGERRAKQDEKAQQAKESLEKDKQKTRKRYTEDGELVDDEPVGPSGSTGARFNVQDFGDTMPSTARTGKAGRNQRYDAEIEVEEEEEEEERPRRSKSKPKSARYSRDEDEEEPEEDDAFAQLEAKLARIVPPPSSATPSLARKLTSGHNTVPKKVTDVPRVYVAENFLKPEEVDYLLQRALDNVDAEAFEDTRETGISMEMPIDDDLILRNIARRQYQFAGLTNSEHSTFRVRRYVKNKFHPLHTDTYNIGNNTLIASMLIYLTTPVEGGETFFPYAHLTPQEAASREKRGADYNNPNYYADKGMELVPAKAGNMIVWYSCTRDGKDDKMSTHGSRPIVKGVKWTYTNFVYSSTADCAVDPPMKVDDIPIDDEEVEAWHVSQAAQKAEQKRRKDYASQTKKPSKKAPSKSRGPSRSRRGDAEDEEEDREVMVEVDARGGTTTKKGQTKGKGGKKGLVTAADVDKMTFEELTAVDPNLIDWGNLKDKQLRKLLGDDYKKILKEGPSASADDDRADKGSRKKKPSRRYEEEEEEEDVEARREEEEEEDGGNDDYAPGYESSDSKIVPPSISREEARRITATHNPQVVQVSDVPGPRAWLVKRFLNEEEVAYFMNRSLANVEGGAFNDNQETGISLEMPVSNDPILVHMTQRQYKWLGFANTEGSTIRVRRYIKSKYHPLHTDTYTIGDNTLLVTMLVYITSPPDGGETFFPHAFADPSKNRALKFDSDRAKYPDLDYTDRKVFDDMLVIKPVAGDMIVWFSCTPDGTDDIMSVHGSKPMVTGVKWTWTNFVYAEKKHCASKPSNDNPSSSLEVDFDSIDWKATKVRFSE